MTINYSPQVIATQIKNCPVGVVTLVTALLCQRTTYSNTTVRFS